MILACPETCGVCGFAGAKSWRNRGKDRKRQLFADPVAEVVSSERQQAPFDSIGGAYTLGPSRQYCAGASSAALQVLQVKPTIMRCDSVAPAKPSPGRLCVVPSTVRSINVGCWLQVKRKAISSGHGNLTQLHHGLGVWQHLAQRCLPRPACNSHDGGCAARHTKASSRCMINIIEDQKVPNSGESENPTTRKIVSPGRR